MTDQWQHEYAKSVQTRGGSPWWQPKFHHLNPHVPGHAECVPTIILNTENIVSSPPDGEYCKACQRLWRHYQGRTAPVAQRKEHRPFNPGVRGSNPLGRANRKYPLTPCEMIDDFIDRIMTILNEMPTAYREAATVNFLCSLQTGFLYAEITLLTRSQPA